MSIRIDLPWYSSEGVPLRPPIAVPCLGRGIRKRRYRPRDGQP